MCTRTARTGRLISPQFCSVRHVRFAPIASEIQRRSEATLRAKKPTMPRASMDESQQKSSGSFVTPCRWRLQVRSPTAPSSRVLIPIWCSWSMAGQNGSTGGNIVISRRLVIALLGAGGVAVALYAAPVAPALSPEARNAKLDETLRGLVEGRSTPGIVALILQNGRPVYSRSVGVREVGSAAPIGENDMFRLASMTKAVTSVAA